MKYFFVSDIHGEYDKLVDALTKSKFDATKDTLVVVGDSFDRGQNNIAVLKFLLSLPNKILLFGNHDLRLKKLLDKVDTATWADAHNGTINTIHEFSSMSVGSSEQVLLAIDVLNQHDHPIGKLIHKYFDRCSYAVEFKDLVATHGWLPVTKEKTEVFEEFNISVDKNWRAVDRDVWYKATWAQTEDLIKANAWPEKTILVGHWYAWQIAEHCYKEDRYKNEVLDTSLFISPDHKLIAIDGCAPNKHGQVNVYVYETDEIPKLY